MLAWTIAAARLSLEIDRIVVSTDSEEYAEIARRYCADVPFLRPAEYARDDSPDIEFVQHAIDWFDKNDYFIPEFLVHLRPSTPIRDVRLIDEAIREIKSDPSATSLRSGHICANTPFKWFRFADTGYMRPLIDGITMEQTNLPRQEFPEAFVPNGYIDVLRSDFIISSGQMHGDRMIGFTTSEIPDIDTEDDLRKLDMYSERGVVVEGLLAELERTSGAIK